MAQTVRQHKTLQFLRQRQIAYKLAFSKKRIVTSLRRAFRSVFGSYAGQAVLIDLAKFCRAHETTYHPTQDRRTQEILEGRRQVWIRIQDHMRLSQEQLFTIYSGQNFPAELEGENDDG